VVAVAAKIAPQAPAGALDGIYPVWVRLTDTSTGTPAPAPILVDGDGWNLAPTGDKWTIESVGAAGTAGDQFTYAVEYVTDLAECGQVNGGASAAVSALVSALQVLRPMQAAAINLGSSFTLTRPGWARKLLITCYASSGNMSGGSCNLIALDTGLQLNKGTINTGIPGAFEVPLVAMGFQARSDAGSPWTFADLGTGFGCPETPMPPPPLLRFDVVATIGIIGTGGLFARWFA
jgi:hypothetical protein